MSRPPSLPRGGPPPRVIRPLLLAALVVVTAVSCSSSTDSPAPVGQPAPPAPPPAAQTTRFVDPGAQTLHVPLDAPTIQAGIDAVASGGTVTVAPGVYRENLSFNGKSVAIVGQGDWGSVVIDGDGATALSVGEGDVFLENLTLRNSEVAVDLQRSASLVMVRCEVSHSNWGLRSHFSGPAQVFYSLFHHNKVGFAFTYYGEDSLVVGSTFADNSEADISWRPKGSPLYPVS